MISDIKPPEIEIHFPASRRKGDGVGWGGGVNEYQWPPGLVWSGLSWVSVSLPLPHHAGPFSCFSLSSCSEG